MLFTIVNKISVHISTVKHITQQKLCCLFICYCNLCDGLKNWFVCAFWLSVHMKSAVEHLFFHEFAFNDKVLKAFIEFQI